MGREENEAVARRNQILDAALLPEVSAVLCKRASRAQGLANGDPVTEELLGQLVCLAHLVTRPAVQIDAVRIDDAPTAQHQRLGRIRAGGALIVIERLLAFAVVGQEHRGDEPAGPMQKARLATPPDQQAGLADPLGAAQQEPGRL